MVGQKVCSWLPSTFLILIICSSNDLHVLALTVKDFCFLLKTSTGLLSMLTCSVFRLCNAVVLYL